MPRPLNTYRPPQRLDSVSRFLVQNTSMQGTELISPAGEALFEVEFPVYFTEKPIMTFGWELPDSSFLTSFDEDSPLSTGYPSATALVVKWDTQVKNKGEMYTGADIAVSVVMPRNAPSIDIILHWRAEGKAIQSPDETSMQ